MPDSKPCKSVAAVVRRLRKGHLQPRRAFLEELLGVTLIPLGEGAFRHVYRVSGLPLVIKLPLESTKSGTRWNKMHTTLEVTKIEKLCKNRLMKKHIPKIYFHDRKSGVLLMEYIPEPQPSKLQGTADEQKNNAMMNFTGDVVRDLTGVRLSDIAIDNLGILNGRVKFLDLGL